MTQLLCPGCNHKQQQSVPKAEAPGRLLWPITGDGDHFARVLTSSVGAGNFQVSNDSDGTPCMYFAIGEIAR